MPIIKGTNGGDTLFGTSAGDTISGLGGNDSIKGFGGADFIDGGAGIDTVFYGDSSAGVSINLATGRCFGGSAEGDSTRASSRSRSGIPSPTGRVWKRRMRSSSASRTSPSGSTRPSPRAASRWDDGVPCSRGISKAARWRRTRRRITLIAAGLRGS